MNNREIAIHLVEGTLDEGVFDKIIEWFKGKYPDAFNKAKEIVKKAKGDIKQMADLLKVDPTKFNAAMEDAKALADKKESLEEAEMMASVINFVKKHWLTIGVTAIAVILIFYFGPQIMQAITGAGHAAASSAGNVLDMNKLQLVDKGSFNSAIGNFDAFKDAAGNIFARASNGDVWIQAKNVVGKQEWVPALTKFSSIIGGF